MAGIVEGVRQIMRRGSGGGDAAKALRAIVGQRAARRTAIWGEYRKLIVQVGRGQSDGDAAAVGRLGELAEMLDLSDAVVERHLEIVSGESKLVVALAALGGEEEACLAATNAEAHANALREQVAREGGDMRPLWEAEAEAARLHDVAGAAREVAHKLRLYRVEHADLLTDEPSEFERAARAHASHQQHVEAAGGVEAINRLAAEVRDLAERRITSKPVGAVDILTASDELVARVRRWEDVVRLHYRKSRELAQITFHLDRMRELELRHPWLCEAPASEARP